MAIAKEYRDNDNNLYDLTLLRNYFDSANVYWGATRCSPVQLAERFRMLTVEKATKWIERFKRQRALMSQLSN